MTPYQIGVVVGIVVGLVVATSFWWATRKKEGEASKPKGGIK